MSAETDWGHSCEGGRTCTLHNIHCAYPKCEKGRSERKRKRRPSSPTATPEPAAEAKCANCGHGESQHSGGGQWKGMSWCCNPASGERASPWTALCNCLKFIRRDPAAGEEPTTAPEIEELIQVLDRAAQDYGWEREHGPASIEKQRLDEAKQALRRSLQESRSELARLQGLLAEGLGLMRESHDEIAALKQSIIQSQLRAEDAERKLAELMEVAERFACKVFDVKDLAALQASLADHPEKP